MLPPARQSSVGGQGTSDIAGALTRWGLDAGDVQERRARLFAGLLSRTLTGRTRCRRKVQTLAEAVAVPAPGSPPATLHVDPIGASV